MTEVLDLAACIGSAKENTLQFYLLARLWSPKNVYIGMIAICRSKAILDWVRSDRKPKPLHNLTR